MNSMDKKSNKHMSATHKSTNLFAQSRKKAEQLAKRKTKVSFLQGIKDELRKVSWTSRADLIQCTKIVVGSTVAFGMGIYIADLFIRGVLTGFSSLIRLIGG